MVIDAAIFLLAFGWLVGVSVLLPLPEFPLSMFIVSVLFSVLGCLWVNFTIKSANSLKEFAVFRGSAGPKPHRLFVLASVAFFGSMSGVLFTMFLQIALVKQSLLLPASHAIVGIAFLLCSKIAKTASEEDTRKNGNNSKS